MSGTLLKQGSSRADCRERKTFLLSQCSQLNFLADITVQLLPLGLSVAGRLSPAKTMGSVFRKKQFSPPLASVISNLDTSAVHDRP